MPSRAVEAALLAAVGIAATALAFTLLKPYLFPQRAIKLEMIRDNVENLATILDKKGGKFTPQTTYTFRSEGALLRLRVQTFVEQPATQPKEYTLQLPTVNTTIGDMRTLIIRGDPTPYANATGSTLVIVDNGRVEVVARPVIHVEGLRILRFQVQVHPSDAHQARARARRQAGGALHCDSGLSHRRDT
jgi:hypothetical protein